MVEHYDTTAEIAEVIMRRPLTAIALLTSATAAAPAPAAPQTLAITDVNVVDVGGGVARPGMTVVVSGDRILALGPSGSVDVPGDARVVDGTGRFLIPGLWDMHVHTGSDENTRGIMYPLLVAHGVTGMRNMMGDCYDCGPVYFAIDQVHARRRAVAAGELLGPRVVASSAYAGSHEQAARRSSEGSSPRAPATEADARAFVRLAQSRGADFIKVYDMLPREAYFALAEEADRLGLPIAGHVPVAVRASEASDAGQRSIEHLGMGNVLEECSSREGELRARVIAELEKAEMGSRHTADGSALLPLVLEMVESYDPAKCAALASRFLRNGTWFVPTLMTSRLPSELGAGWREDPYARFLPPDERQYFEMAEVAVTSDLGTAEERAPVHRWVREVTGDMHRAGVPLLAGSDPGTPGVFWGIGLHQELELLVSAGLTAADALRAATLGPAQFLETTDSLGTVEAGKLADLVLLNANPLADISNARQIEAVVLRGRYLDREALDALLTGAERAAQSRDPTGLSDTVHVAPPTGVRETDRASILAALDHVRPGGTVRFAPGTYLIGGLNLDVAVPRITLLGHPDGTTLQGCEPDQFIDFEVAMFACNALGLSGGHQTVRDLTFEHAWHGITIGCCLPGSAKEFETWEGPERTQPGGHLIEGNTFRFTPNGMRVLGRSTEPTVIQNNRFIDVYHAIGINGGGVHFLDNDISVHEPHRVPTSTHPGDAINLLPAGTSDDHTTCTANLIAGNRIVGYTHGIRIGVYSPATSCRGNIVRDNTIRVGRVTFASLWFGIEMQEVSDSTVVGFPIGLINFPLADPETYGAADEPGREAMIEDNVIERNHIIGAYGVGIEILHASRNRIAHNTVTGIRLREPFPGNVLSEEPVMWRDANGSGIWISAGSVRNEILGNTFDDIDGSAVVIEGNSNRVQLQSGDHRVRDLGTGNDITVAATAAEQIRVTRR